MYSYLCTKSLSYLTFRQYELAKAIDLTFITCISEIESCKDVIYSVSGNKHTAKL